MRERWAMRLTLLVRGQGVWQLGRIQRCNVDLNVFALAKDHDTNDTNE
jgi:hypothetical protein